MAVSQNPQQVAAGVVRIADQRNRVSLDPSPADGVGIILRDPGIPPAKAACSAVGMSMPIARESLVARTGRGSSFIK